MTQLPHSDTSDPHRIWIISKGRYSAWQPPDAAGPEPKGPTKEYRLSELARFMLDPRPVQVKRRLVGCEVAYRQPLGIRMGRRLERCLPSALRGWAERRATPPEVFVSAAAAAAPAVDDPHLDQHLKGLERQLREHDPLLHELLTLDRGRLTRITGLCDDLGGKHLRLRLNGTIDDNIDYLCSHLQSEVTVVLDNTYAAPGLFELRGLDLEPGSLQQSHRLVKCSRAGKPAACVLGDDQRPAFWVENPKRINYLHLLELAIRSNRQFQLSLKRCLYGKARLLRIFFNRQPIVDYSSNHFPETYRDVISTSQLAHTAKDDLLNSLNHLQLGISLQTVSESDAGQKQLDTHVSVMHNFRALEPIKAHLPELYDAIDKRTEVSEAGKFYLLDSLQGTLNEQ
jgi:hypothetical protein